MHWRRHDVWIVLALVGWSFPGAARASGDLEVWIEPARRQAKPGQEIVSHIRVRNRGPEAATDITVQLNLSDDFNPVRLHGPHGSCDPEWCNVARLEPGASAVFKLVTVLCCVPPGVVREAWIRVEVRAATPDPRPESNEFTATVDIRPRP